MSGLSETHKIVTLNEFIIDSQKGFDFATGELSGLLHHIGLAAKIVNREVNKAGLVGILGAAGSNNVHGEDVQRLDIFANMHFHKAMRNSEFCGGIASEEDDDCVIYEGERARNAKYVVCIDPLDGSSNIDVNVSIGTIFGIYRRISPVGQPCVERDFLQAGNQLVAAGYIIYGSSTMLVYTTGTRVNGFTLDPSIGEFCLSHRDIKTPLQGRIYSINESYQSQFSDGVNRYLDYCKQHEPFTGRPYSSRYIGSMVADVHRNLIKGGIFAYPRTKDNPNGKLRLLYECNPLAFIVEKAGGMATDGKNRILDIQPTELHQRLPIYLGSTSMVRKAMQFVQGKEEVI
ncbi:MAG: class 1 fructose-bisphosphatase [Chitinophagales bacterium]